MTAFIDVGGRGYSTVPAIGDELEIEFVCVPRSISSLQALGLSGGRPLLVHSAALRLRSCGKLASHLPRMLFDMT